MELVSRDDATRQALPASFVHPDDTWSVSPDGDKVLRSTVDGSGELYTASLSTVTRVADEGVVAPAWAPDSSFVAWVDLDGEEPLLKVLRLDGSDSVIVDLGVLGESAPTDSQLLVIPQSAS